MSHTELLSANNWKCTGWALTTHNQNWPEAVWARKLLQRQLSVLQQCPFFLGNSQHFTKTVSEFTYPGISKGLTGVVVLVWMKDWLLWPGSSALKVLLGRVGRTGSQGSWNPAESEFTESVKDGAAHQSTTVGCQTSKQGDMVLQKWFFSCALNILYATVHTFLCCYLSLHFALFQCIYSAPNK